VVSDPTDPEIEAALASERQFVFTLGGFALEIAGAALVTHEKIPVPRFNFVQELGIGRERQTAFFEHALDHYFQRALRPLFRVPLPVPPHVDAGLRRFGFCPKTSPLVLMLAGGPAAQPLHPAVRVRLAEHTDLDLIASFWTSERERPEFRTALDIAWTHPNPHEALVPLLALVDGEVVSAALVYRYRSAAGIHAVATRPSARGRGAASDLVRFAVSHEVAGPGVQYSMFSDSPRLERRLEALGFRAARSFTEYELPPSAELAFPSPGPPLAPQWRPPRTPRSERRDASD
jgi:GNAT superfamily N-acetyltransferase